MYPATANWGSNEQLPKIEGSIPPSRITWSWRIMRPLSWMTEARDMDSTFTKRLSNQLQHVRCIEHDTNTSPTILIPMFVAGPSHTTPFTTIPASLQRLIVPFTKAAISTPLRFPLVKKYPTIFSSPLFINLSIITITLLAISGSFWACV
uniref:Uncharacterized protein n=1 Tax=Daphnia galeata TaxID=27404 RepID=A0A8J2S0B1_9CRUS|nr:unnamed protein product [Daphnia galeata]